jgi:muramoyltetrapeptide carboxypeptidase
LHACAAAGRLRIAAGSVLLIEDVTEMPYRLDRMLTTLRVGGALDGVSAVVVGELTQCNPGADGVSAIEAIARGLRPLGVPVVSGLLVGHGACNEPLVLGAPARVSATSRGSLTLF